LVGTLNRKNRVLKSELSKVSPELHYKIKLRSAGYRLVYEVEEKVISVYVICVGRRGTIYKILKKRQSRKLHS